MYRLDADWSSEDTCRNCVALSVYFLCAFVWFGIDINVWQYSALPHLFNFLKVIYIFSLLYLYSFRNITLLVVCFIYFVVVV